MFSRRMRLTDHYGNPATDPGFQDQPSPKRSAFVTVSFNGGVLSVKPAGPKLSEREAPIVSAESMEAMNSLSGKVRVLVLDVAEVQIMSSFGLGMCIDLRNAAKAIRASTVVYGLNDELIKLFKLMKVDRLYTIVRNAAELERAIAA